MSNRRRTRRSPAPGRGSFLPLAALAFSLAGSDATGPEPEIPLDTPFTFTQVEGTLAGVHLYAASADGSTLLAVGMFGTILRSTDGGATWSAVASGTTVFLEGVWVDGETAVAVGESGTVLRSMDGGASWRTLPAGTIDAAMDLRALAGHGVTLVAGGYHGTPFQPGPLRPVVLQSVDGGAVWTAQEFPSHRQIDAAWIPDDRSVIVVGEGGWILRGTR